MKGIIYEYYNASTNMYYIGQTRDRLAKRDWSHRKGKGTNSYFDNAYHKHPEQFSLKTLVEINFNSKELLIKTLNLLEITYIRHYKFLKRKLYNISKGGNLSLQGITPTPKMLKALEEGRINNNNKLKANKFSKEEIKERHRVQSKMYTINNPEKYKEIYIALDGDKAGIEDSKKLQEETGFKIIDCPLIDKAKDWSDIYYFYGKEALLKEFKKALENAH